MVVFIRKHIQYIIYIYIYICECVGGIAAHGCSPVNLMRTWFCCLPPSLPSISHVRWQPATEETQWPRVAGKGDSSSKHTRPALAWRAISMATPCRKQMETTSDNL